MCASLPLMIRNSSTMHRTNHGRILTPAWEMNLCNSVCHKSGEFGPVCSHFICQAGKKNPPWDANNTHVVHPALPPVFPQSVSVSCLANATGGTCVHTAHSLWLWAHLSTWPTQLLSCSLQAQHNFFCAMTSAEWRGSEESWPLCASADKQDFFVKLKLL